MKIALLTADAGNDAPNIGDHFITLAVERLFSGHELTRVPLHTTPSESTLKHLNSQHHLIVCGSNIIGANGTLRSGYSRAHWQEIHRPITLLGMGAQADLNTPVKLDKDGEEILRYFAANHSPMSVRDHLTRAALEEKLGPGFTTLTGCPSLFLEESPFRRSSPRTVFCPGPFHYQMPSLNRERYWALPGQIYRRLKEKGPVLWLAQQPSDLWFQGPLPGLETLYCPREPLAHLKALVSAGSVLSFRIHPALVASRNGVPAGLVAIDERTRSMAETLRLPYLTLTPELTPVTILEWFHETLAHYPWAEIRDAQEKLKREMSRYLEGQGLSPRGASFLPSRKRLTLATISDSTYEPSLHGLLENLRSVGENELECHILELEPLHKENLRASFPEMRLHFHTWEELFSAEELKNLNPRNIPRRAYTAKARLLKKALAMSSGAVLFSDVDLYYLRSPRHLVESTRECVLLFPQHNDVPRHERTHGLFNSGLLLVRPGGECFLNWWDTQSRGACEVSAREGLFYEQRYLDAAPVRFAEVSVYRGHDENIASWNLKTLNVVVPPECPWRPRTAEGKVIGSIHAALPDPLSIFTAKVGWDQAVHFFSPTRFSELPGRHQTYLLDAQARYWPRLRALFFFHSTLTRRLRLPSPLLTKRALNLLVNGQGRWLLDVTTWFYGKARAGYRKIRRWRVRQDIDEIFNDRGASDLLSTERQIEKLKKKLPIEPSPGLSFRRDTNATPELDATRS